MPSLRSGKTQTDKCTLKTRIKRTYVHREADDVSNETPGPEIVMISAEDANHEMLQLAAEAAETVPPIERNSEWPISVPGRLGLTGSKGKAYQVTKDEVTRRLAAPEKLSASALCQYLKRRRQTAALPAGIPHLRKKVKTSCSLFTLLTEGEARDLARDFGEIMKEEKFFEPLSQSIDIDNKQAVRDSCIQLMEALDSIVQTRCKASLRQHGFLVPAVREVFKQLNEELQE